ncbi:MAG TPA: uracil-DNA glycosylase family protein [Paenalcaligenes sp.]|nr:uracil-DNA glycosylase family protein [Paenalcaligenes sp.]
MSADRMLEISRELSQALDQLKWITPSHVYNPLDYAWANHEEYIRRYGGQQGRILMVGMNPGPWGMAQTGIPFGDIGFVTQWLQLCAPLSGPLPEQHPKYPILGMECHRREGSGQRLWGWAQERFVTPQKFFEQAFVWNYCPLLFLGQGRNLIPEKLKKAERDALTPLCDDALRAVIECLQPRVLVGIGRYAEQRIRTVMGADTEVQYLLHPSPASPQANKNWVQHADALFAQYIPNQI